MMNASRHEPVALSVPDLTEALDFFTRRLGFRLEMIMPADAPRLALLAGQGLRVRLEAATTVPPAATDAWQTGRAGMEYRDLIPGRLAGAFIASQIRIRAGGEVPDYVHYHKIRFQMIFCKAGWVRVVYEDQGPPFILEAGDCVLQPPGIRHRVLEASPGLEVIEIGAPAVHETWVDHVLTLPTGQTLPERLFDGQRFVRHRASAAQWTPWRLDGFAARDTGIAAATGGLADVRIVRAPRELAATLPAHTGEFLFFFVLRGELRLDARRLNADDCCVIPAGAAIELRASDGLEFLEVGLPARWPAR
ncbi:MAG: cupin domain-containing protein [Blastocatellia bacterium]|nr:cupin domain-containing protein [Blastocatellia bacterium]